MTTVVLIERIVVPAVVLALLVGGIAGVAVGTGLVFRSQATLAFIARMNRWVSTRRALKPLEIPRSLEPASVPGAPQPRLGAFLFLSGALVVYVLALRLHVPHVSFASGMRAVLLSMAIDATRWILVCGAVAGMALGVLMIFAPARYAALTACLNRWYSTRTLIPPGADAMRFAFEPPVQAHPQAAGWVITIASLAIALAMAWLLVARVPY
jgi:hypothetical protein